MPCTNLTAESCCTVACHLAFSPPSPPISFSARCSFTVHSATCLASMAFLAVASAYEASNDLILAETAWKEHSQHSDLMHRFSWCSLLPLKAPEIGTAQKSAAHPWQRHLMCTRAASEMGRAIHW